MQRDLRQVAKAFRGQSQRLFLNIETEDAPRRADTRHNLAVAGAPRPPPPAARPC